MASIIFIINKEKIIINCSKDDYIEDLINKFTREKNIYNENIIYLYKGKKMKLKNTFKNEIKKEDMKTNKMIVLCI